MSGHVDHAAEALTTLARIRGVDEATNQITLALEAQVHAALALVEQQRIANLIALAQHASERYGPYAGEAGGMGTLFSYGEAETDNMRIRDGIREALRLS